MYSLTRRGTPISLEIRLHSSICADVSISPTTERMTLEDIFLKLTTPQFDEALPDEELDPIEDEQEEDEL